VHLLSPDNITPTPFAAGDAALVIKADGRIQLMNAYDLTHGPTQAQKDDTEKLMALSAAWSIPIVMDMLLKLIRDPEVFVDGLVNYGTKQ
jgi:hypothetical protein